MGKGDRAENYYTQQDDEWIPIYLGGSKGSKSSKSSDSTSEEYYVKRDGKWVKISGVQSTADLIERLKISSSQPNYAPPGYSTAVLGQSQAPVLVAPTPQAPLEYREYFVTVNPSSSPAEPPLEPITVPLGPKRIPRQPIGDRAVPNEYADGPIVAERVPVYRNSPPPERRRRGPPRPRYVSPRRNCSPPPPPLQEPHYRERIDAYAMGREAYYRENAGAIDYVKDSCGCDEGAVTSPTSGYYLAGYIYYGDPSQPPPKLEPISAAGAVTAPPGHYLAGYTTGGSC